MENTLHLEDVITQLLCPETDIERALISDPEFKKGLFWGKPRYGHPEGKIIYHISEVLANIDRLDLDATTRRQLRLIAYVHDTFKHLEDQNRPRDWSKHHGVIAKKFAEKYTRDKKVLHIIETHDEAYYSWRMQVIYGKVEEGKQRLQELLESLDNQIQLFYLFFKCDTQTGDKTQAPVKWFESTITEIELINL